LTVKVDGWMDGWLRSGLESIFASEAADRQYFRGKERSAACP
jgi:hypothetical protein